MPKQCFSPDKKSVLGKCSPRLLFCRLKRRVNTGRGTHYLGFFFFDIGDMSGASYSFGKVLLLFIKTRRRILTPHLPRIHPTPRPSILPRRQNGTTQHSISTIAITPSLTRRQNNTSTRFIACICRAFRE